MLIDILLFPFCDLCDLCGKINLLAARPRYVLLFSPSATADVLTAPCAAIIPNLQSHIIN